jgi:hypothetical protein
MKAYDNFSLYQKHQAHSDEMSNWQKEIYFQDMMDQEIFSHHSSLKEHM